MYAFNHEVVADVFYAHDVEGTCFGWLSMLCNGTTFHAAALVYVGKGTPSSAKCWSKFPNWKLAKERTSNLLKAVPRMSCLLLVDICI